MTAKIIVFALVSFFHDLFTAIWVGGLIVTAISFMPSVKSTLGASPQTKKVMSEFQNRQSIWVYISITGLIITGLMMSNRSPEFGGLFNFSNAYSITLSLKHILVLVMTSIALYRSLVLGREKGSSSQAKERLNARLLLINIFLALAVLLTSGFAAALSSPAGID